MTNDGQELDWHRACQPGELEDGDMLAVDIGRRELAIYRVGDRFYATDRICTHGFVDLTDGFLDDYIIQCPLHAGCFDIRTGKGQGSPILRDLKTYPVRMADGGIEVGLPPPLP